uniref:Ovule protein n=1 Tax=Heterorhabditis bacteriophora TaxID=37862 RepID=A0A1I7WIH6_HETBA
MNLASSHCYIMLINLLNSPKQYSYLNCKSSNQIILHFYNFPPNFGKIEKYRFLCPFPFVVSQKNLVIILLQLLHLITRTTKKFRKMGNSLFTICFL